jgi:hypothetical protein
MTLMNQHFTVVVRKFDKEDALAGRSGSNRHQGAYRPGGAAQCRRA